MKQIFILSAIIIALVSCSHKPNGVTETKYVQLEDSIQISGVRSGDTVRVETYNLLTKPKTITYGIWIKDAHMQITVNSEDVTRTPIVLGISGIYAFTDCFTRLIAATPFNNHLQKWFNKYKLIPYNI